MEVITSTKNDTIKLIRSLALKKQRTETGLFAAEGREMLSRARATGWKPHTLLLRAGSDAQALLPWGREAGARCLLASEAVMKAVSSQDNAADGIALFQQRWLDAGPSVPQEALWIALENIRDPGNLGTIIRTADAVSAAGIILIGAACDPYGPDCVRATTGSIFAVPLLRQSEAEFATLLKTWPGESVGTAADAQASFRRDYRAPTLLVMGSEREGLSPSLSALCSIRVRIPMSGGTESLNIAVAAALMLYQIRKAALA
ncbi:MAG: RNA methyltransferase [Rhizobiales bacterium]|nr:RNA methyltransferase [Hyphomicrobiales bacterium]